MHKLIEEDLSNARNSTPSGFSVFLSDLGAKHSVVSVQVDRFSTRKSLRKGAD